MHGIRRIWAIDGGGGWVGKRWLCWSGGGRGTTAGADAHGGVRLVMMAQGGRTHGGMRVAMVLGDARGVRRDGLGRPATTGGGG